MASENTQVLLIEDTSSDAELIRAWLEETGTEDFKIIHVTDIAAALPFLTGPKPQIVLLDLSLPDANGLEGLASIQNVAPTVPVVIMTGRDDEALALKAVEEGAQDYLIKNKADGTLLRRAINYAIQRKRFEDEIIRQANFDKLTGLANSALFENRLNMALAHAQRSQQEVGLFLLDLDSFKQVNDTYGHAAGDKLLKEIGNRITQCLRPYDTAARLGGDEFAVLIEGMANPQDCAIVAQKLAKHINLPVSIGTQNVEVGVSIGIATCNGNEKYTVEALMSNADEAMYRAKNDSENHYCFYAGSADEIWRCRAQLESALRKAISNDELALCYQPKQALASGDISGLEALVRWHHPERGTLLPGEFLNAVQDVGLLRDIESWILAQACRDMKRWREMGLPPAPVSVNVSATQFDALGFVSFLALLMGRYGIRHKQLVLELPEAVFAGLDDTRDQKLAALHKHGIALAIDHFSGPASSLGILKSFALSELKFDSRFTGDVESRSENRRLLKAVTACAHELGIKVAVSGVETDSLRACLREQNCDTLQGFIFGRPMPAAYLENWLRNKYALSIEAVA